MPEKENNKTEFSVAFVHGRPGGHPFNASLAHAIHAQFFFTDAVLKYADRDKEGVRRYFSWVLTALFLPLRRFSIVFTESFRFPVFFMRLFGRTGKKRKAVALVCDETLFFLETEYYKPSTQKAFLKLLKSYDGFVCLGQFQAGLLTSLLGPQCNYVTSFCGTSLQRVNELKQVKPNLAGNTILLIANGPGGFRTWYKGLDLMLQAFEKVKEELAHLRFVIVGEWTPEVTTALLSKHCQASASSVEFKGRQQNLAPYLQEAALYLHCARGEAWGISINEALCAGVPAMVSKYTGASEVVVQVSDQLITTLEVDEITKKIKWYFSLSLPEKEALAARGRQVASFYTEDNAAKDFREKFQLLVKKMYHNP